MNPIRLEEELKKIDRRLSIVFNPLKSRYEVICYDDAGRKYVLYRVRLGELHMYAQQIISGIKKARQTSPMQKLREIEAEEEREEAAEIKRLEDDIDHLTSEGYEIFKRLCGERISLPGFTINDKRCVKPEDKDNDKKQDSQAEIRATDCSI